MCNKSCTDCTFLVKYVEFINFFETFMCNFVRWTDLRDLDLRTSLFALRQIRAATGNFHISNKLGEGGFGSVYKGLLSDSTSIAVKQLSSKSKQGSPVFVTEIGMISTLQHPNLVKLYGCCIEGDQLLLVYEYIANNSLAYALFGELICFCTNMCMQYGCNRK
ncbi:probable LRR receptor-like serine/threonine-protein kinase At1g53440 [Magnolia sinica]|uniref:probable LRR receptor-like serine/threonine-protein kinase At1g53440 n=1 Tax=Magnolia sinica TaxID=86752 RepID=UPI00265ABC22|nr:probable LRR receptor-like serine/threonine-protein kinase At1g53440 [Magnolia sinica]